MLFVTACSGGADGTPGSTFTQSSEPPQSPSSTDEPSPSTTDDPASSFTEVNRSIVGIIPAADIGDDGQPVGPGFTFSPETPQITIVAQAGAVTGSPMDITWFQITSEGEEELFTHTVEVANYQTAYSVGRSPGTIATGTYRVEATLEGESLSTTFVVEAPDTESAMASRVAARPAVGGAMGQGATSGPPASGDSGAVGPRFDPETGAASTFLGAWLAQEPVDPGARDIILEIGAGVVGGGARVEANVEMGGNLRTISIPTGNDGLLVRYLSFDPCAHPGGSDLPGTRARFVTNLLGEGSQEFLADTVQNDTELGDDQTHPEITINAPPPSARRVAPGDEIVIDASAQETRDGPTWQTGLSSFKLVADPGGLVGEEQRSDAGSAQPCNSKQWSLASQATYTVPADAPPRIGICAIAEDFAGNEVSTCFDLYTGEVWEGPLTGEAFIPGCDPNPVPITGQLEAVVGSDGTVTGTVREVRGSFSCQGGPQSGVLDRTNPFTGTKTAAAFVLELYGETVTLPIVGTHATATADFLGSAGHGVLYTYTFDCVTCGP